MRKSTLVGMTTLIMAAVVGIGYAQDTTPAPTGTPVPPATADSTTQTKATRAWLGVAITDTTDGVSVERVQRGSAAEAAGLLAGDVIVSVNSTDVATGADLRALVEAAAPGDILSLGLQRGEDEITVAVTLTSRGAGRSASIPTDPLEAAEWVLSADLNTGEAGYEVVALSGRSHFALVAGDVVTDVNGEPIATVDWATLLTATDAATPVTLTVQRNGETVSIQGNLSFRGGHGGRGRGDKGGMGGGRRDRGGNDLPGSNGQETAPVVPGTQPGSSDTAPDTSSSNSF